MVLQVTDGRLPINKYKQKMHISTPRYPKLAEHNTESVLFSDDSNPKESLISNKEDQYKVVKVQTREYQRRVLFSARIT